MIYISQLVPALAGTLQQLNNMVLANFDPPGAAYKSIGGGQMSLSVDVGVKLDGLLGLPTPDSPVVNAIFSRAGSSNRKSIHPQFFKGVLSAPYEHTDIPTCTKQSFYFDETYAHPFRVKGSTVQGECREANEAVQLTQKGNVAYLSRTTPHCSALSLTAVGHDIQERLWIEHCCTVGQSVRPWPVRASTCAARSI